jgi:hypothetical protein
VSATGAHSHDIAAHARWRRVRRMLMAVVLGAVVGAYTLGALATRVSDNDDLLPVPLEALVLGAAFALGALPVNGAMLARALIPVPTLLLFLSVFLGRAEPLPFAAAFVLALVHAIALTALSTALAERPHNALLGSRR